MGKSNKEHKLEFTITTSRKDWAIFLAPAWAMWAVTRSLAAIAILFLFQFVINTQQAKVSAEAMQGLMIMSALAAIAIAGWAFVRLSRALAQLPERKSWDVLIDCNGITARSGAQVVFLPRESWKKPKVNNRGIFVSTHKGAIILPQQQLEAAGAQDKARAFIWNADSTQ